MPKTARRNSIVVLIALCVPHLFFAFLRGALGGRPTPISYFARCGGDYVLWLMCCCASASLASLTASGGLVYSVLRRTKGHPLNGISLTWAGFAASVGLLAGSVVFFNLAKAPCWVTPALYSIVTVAAGLTAVHTMRRTPTLIGVPDFQIDHLIRAGEARLRQIQQSPGSASPEEDQQFAPLLREILDNLKQINDRPSETSGGAQ